MTAPTIVIVLIGLVRARLLPVAEPVPLTLRLLGVVIVLAVVGVLVGPLWRVLRIGVTLVHELGHAFVGLLFGRRFHGFVLRGDMSGHALTSGPTRGLGRIATTWAGYPMPGLVAFLLVWVARDGYAGCALFVALLALVIALPRVRSVLTLTVVLAVGAAVGALWWWRDDARQAQVLVGVAIVLLVGGWRHVWAVRAAPEGSDPTVLRQLTHLPAALWNLTFVAVLAASTWGTWRLVSAV